MKKLVLFAMLVTVGSLLLAGPLMAEDNAETTIGVLNESSFVVVQKRGFDNSSVLLYRVTDGKLQMIDALVIDGDFADVSRPTVRVLRAVTK